MDKDARRIWGLCLTFIGCFILGFGVGVENLWFFIGGTASALAGIFVLPDEDKLSDKRFKVVPYWK